MRPLAAFTACALSIASLGLTGTSVAATRGAAYRHWHVVFQTPANRIGALDSVIAPSPTSAWTFGWSWTGGPQAPSYPIARHWNGHRWSSVAMPSSLRGSGIACAGASSPVNVWAFAGAGAARAGDPPAIAAALRLHGGDIGWLSFSTDNGQTWSAPLRVTPDQDNAIHNVEVVGTVAGRAAVAWQADNSPDGYATEAQPAARRPLR